MYPKFAYHGAEQMMEYKHVKEIGISASTIGQKQSQSAEKGQQNLNKVHIILNANIFKINYKHIQCCLSKTGFHILTTL